ncbi:MAG: hypothetical protein K2X44_06340, partial [Magnetospirillum sp.]|nr:hypothetical protein [Magnetospirillum sp.]
HRQLGQYDTAHEEYEQARLLYGETGDALGEAAACHGLGHILTHLNNRSEARRFFDTARHLYAATGHLKGEAEILMDLGRHLTLEDPIKAQSAFKHAASLFKRMDDPRIAEAEQELGKFF